MIYLFDVDGTLTDSRQKIDKDFEYYLINFFSYYDCSIVTGSDYSKTEEQLGTTLCNLADYSFNCSGNSVWQKGNQIYSSEWTLPENVRDYLEYELQQSGFEIKTGNHIEDRPGSVNFSIVGRNANFDERQYYRTYDIRFNERSIICNNINEKFKDVSALVGGETGIDIFETDKDKRQVIDYFPNRTFCFFGDKTNPGGNDYPLANILSDYNTNCVFQVSNWQETEKILKLLDGREKIV